MTVSKKMIPVALSTSVLTAVPVLASSDGGGLSTVESALTSSFTSVGSSMTSMVSTILPIALPVMGALLLVSFGIKAFKRVTNKA